MVRKIIFNVVCVQALLSILTMLVWIANKGYDFTDEGYYLVSSLYYNDIKLSMSSFGLYVNLLSRFSNSIVFLRISSVLFNFIAITFLSYNFLSFFINFKQKNVKPSVPISLFIYTVTFLFIFSCFIFKIPLDLNYNSLSVYFSYILLGCFFIALKRIENEKNIYFILVIMGFITANIFFIKFTSGLLLFIIFFVFIYIYKKIHYNKVLEGKFLVVNDFIFLVLGAIIGTCIFFLILQSPYNWFLSIKHWMIYNQLAQSTHSLGLLVHYSKNITKMIAVSSILCTLLILSYYITIKLFKSVKFISNPKFMINFIYGILFIYAFTFLPVTSKYGNVALSITYFFMVEFFISIYFIYKFIYNSNYTFSDNKRLFNKLLLITILLFILPFCISFGTDNNIASHIIYEFVPWGMLIIILYNILEFKIQNKKYLINWLVLIALVMFKTLILSILFEPYRLFDNYFKQNIPTNIVGNNLLLDKQTVNIITDLKYQLKKCGFKDNDYIIPLYDYPGLVFAVNGKIPNCAWYIGGSNASLKATEYCINLYNKIEVDKAYIFVMHNIENENTIPYLNINKLKFPNDYKICSSLVIKSPMHFTAGEQFIKNVDIYKPNK